MTSVEVVEFTDPGCPFAYSAEPHKWRLRWRFGDQLRWRERMVLLAEDRSTYADKGFTPEIQQSSGNALAERYGMPIDGALKPAVAATGPACRAVVAARLHAPDREWLVLRALRVRHFSGMLLDDPETLAAAALDADLEPDDLLAWAADPTTAEALAEDAALARAPTPAALALPGKLARTPEGGWRYTCPSYELTAADGGTFSAPGFQSSLTYETALANLAPGLDVREEPDDVIEVLEWAGVALASQEVAEVCGIDRAEARRRLTQAGAHEQPVGADALWTA